MAGQYSPIASASAAGFEQTAPIGIGRALPYAEEPLLQRGIGQPRPPGHVSGFIATLETLNKHLATLASRIDQHLNGMFGPEPSPDNGAGAKVGREAHSALDALSMQLQAYESILAHLEHQVSRVERL